MTDQPRNWPWEGALQALQATLDAGGMLVVPTESTYGLAVDPRDRQGVDTVFRFKGRPATKPLPVVIAAVEQLALLGADPAAPATVEIAALWPAAVTLVVPIARPLPASAGGMTLAVRVPAHVRLRRLLVELGRPLTATSANPAGEEPVSNVRMLRRMLRGWNCVIVDDGDLPGGPVSTILRVEERGYRIVRQGAVSRSWIGERVSRPVFSAEPAEIPADDRSETA